MGGFRIFLEESEEEEDVQNTLAKLPEKFRRLVRGYSISYQPTSTLNNDRQHVGIVMTHPSPQIILASAFRFSREMILLHEVGHLVYEHLLDHHMKAAWSRLVKQTPMNPEDRQPDEELFSMAFAATYAKHPPTTFYKPAWVDFIKMIAEL